MRTCGNISGARALESLPVRERPQYFKDLGRFLVQLREAQGWTQSAAVAVARRRGLTALSRQILLRMERGQVKDPERDVLVQLALLYRLEPLVVLNRFLQAKYGSDLLGQTSNVESPLLAQGEPHAVQVSYDRLREQHSALLRDLEDLQHTFNAVFVAAVEAAGEQGIKLPNTHHPAQPGTRRPRR